MDFGDRVEEFVAIGIPVDLRRPYHYISEHFEKYLDVSIGTGTAYYQRDALYVCHAHHLFKVSNATEGGALVELPMHGIAWLLRFWRSHRGVVAQTERLTLKDLEEFTCDEDTRIGLEKFAHSCIGAVINRR